MWCKPFLPHNIILHCNHYEHWLQIEHRPLIQNISVNVKLIVAHKNIYKTNWMYLSLCCNWYMYLMWFALVCVTVHVNAWSHTLVLTHCVVMIKCQSDMVLYVYDHCHSVCSLISKEFLLMRRFIYQLNSRQNIDCYVLMFWYTFSKLLELWTM